MAIFHCNQLIALFINENKYTHMWCANCIWLHTRMGHKYIMWHPLSSWMQNNLICVHACIKINDACMYRSLTHYLWHLWGGILTHPYLKHFALSWSISADCGGSYGICRPAAMLLSSNLLKYSSLSAHRKKFLLFFLKWFLFLLTIVPLHVQVP